MSIRFAFPRGIAALTWIAGLLAMVLAQGAGAAEPAVPPDHAAKMKAGMTLFKQHVRPVLIAACVKCHGGAEKKSEFDLTTREGLIKGGAIDKGIVPGKSAESYVYQLIAHLDEPHMPAKAPKLPDATIAKIAEWIDLGAPYDQPLIDLDNVQRKDKSLVSDEDRQFWSFKPLAVVEPPAVKLADWVRTPIDRFILAKLEAQGLRPNPLADRRTLIRRATFDLIGLPPTPEEIDAFVADKDPQAYEKLLDRLLASPHYGERWARHWMDVARFAESHGYEQDYDRPHAYHYRDFLIQALNQDLPYDDFVRWQIAGDELAPKNPLALMATGFLGAGAFPTQLTEAEFESARYDELDDMTATTSSAFLGMSVGCARCHNHKYDPIPAGDYYRMAASFTTAIRTEIDLDLSTDEDRRKLAEHQSQIAKLESELVQYQQKELPAKLKEWLASNEVQKALPGEWAQIAIKSHASTGGAKYEPQADGSLLATGKAPDKDVLTLVAETRRTGIRAFRLEALAHKSLPHSGPGRADNGNFVLGILTVRAEPLDGQGAAQTVALSAARATHQQDTGALSVAASLDADPVTGWAVDKGGIGKDQAAVFQTAEPVGFAEGTRLTFTLTFQHPNARHAIGRPRLSISQAADAKAEVGVSQPPADLLEALEGLKRDWDGHAKLLPIALSWFGREHDTVWKERRAAMDRLQQSAPKPQLVKAQIVSEGVKPMKHHADDRGFPHFYPKTFVLNRGDVHQKKDEAPAGFLQVLMRNGKDASAWSVTPDVSTGTSSIGKPSYRRAALANWMTDVNDGAGHLAARVGVNRVWQHHFGRGIVATPSDFGFQGERPTHPELLDWLAGQMIREGWHLKSVHKLIMTSAVYMQNGDFDEARAKIDRENRFHWRRAPRRLEGEAIRDSMLAVSGLLDTRQFGPGTLDNNMRRRSVYFFIKRSQLIPTMMLFDWPEHLGSIGARSNTTIAPQALLFMNGPQARQYARGLAGRLKGSEGEDAIRQGYRVTLGRVPSDAEMKAGQAFVTGQTASYKTAGKGNAAELALTDFCQTLMSLNEFVYVE